MDEQKKYTLEEAKNEIKLCKTKTDFRKKHRDLYKFAKEQGWLKELSDLIPRRKKWTVETLTKEALKYKTRKEFMESNISAYNTALSSGSFDEIVAHMGEKNNFSPAVKWDYETISEMYKNCTSLKQLRDTYGQKVISCAIRHGWHDDLSKDFVKEPKSNTKWTKKTITKEAKKYNSRGEFGHSSPSADQKALEMGWIDEVTKHMTEGYTNWTTELIDETVKGVETKSDLRKKSSALYAYLARHGLMGNYFRTDGKRKKVK